MEVLLYQLYPPSNCTHMLAHLEANSTHGKNSRKYGNTGIICQTKQIHKFLPGEKKISTQVNDYTAVMATSIVIFIPYNIIEVARLGEPFFSNIISATCTWCYVLNTRWILKHLVCKLSPKCLCYDGPRIIAGSCVLVVVLGTQRSPTGWPGNAENIQLKLPINTE